MSTLWAPVEGSDQAGDARRMASTLASEMGFDEADAARAAIVVTECATNLWKHAGGGDILLSDYDWEGLPCIEAIALDRGPGMTDVARCFQDGYSTAGSAGSGLGAIGRLSQCDVYSQPGKGTAVLARILRRGARVSEGRFAVGGIAAPLPGETLSGDGFAHRENGSSLLAMMADGLGHGPLAARCADLAIDAFHNSREWEPGRLIAEIHGALRGSRGGAVSVARLDPEAREIRFAGVGNVLGMVSAPGLQARNFVTMPGIVGDNIRSVREFTYPWPSGALVLLYSDGISSHWSPEEYAGLALHDPTLISAVIFRDRKRGRDDASVMTIRERTVA